MQLWFWSVLSHGKVISEFWPHCFVASTKSLGLHAISYVSIYTSCVFRCCTSASCFVLACVHASIPWLQPALRCTQCHHATTNVICSYPTTAYAHAVHYDNCNKLYLPVIVLQWTLHVMRSVKLGPRFSLYVVRLIYTIKIEWACLCIMVEKDPHHHTYSCYRDDVCNR